VSSLQGSQEKKAKTTIFEACFVVIVGRNNENCYRVLFPYQVFVDIIFAYFSLSDPESDVTSYDVAWGT